MLVPLPIKFLRMSYPTRRTAKSIANQPSAATFSKVSVVSGHFSSCCNGGEPVHNCFRRFHTTSNYSCTSCTKVDTKTGSGALSIDPFNG